MTDLETGGAPSRLFWADFVRSAGILLVVLIHSSSPLLYRWGEVSAFDWMTGNIYDSLARVSVPLMFMVSGYLLLSRQESVSAFYRKRIVKVVVPFLAWSVIYLLWSNSYANYTPLNAVKAIILATVSAPAFYHLWFLFALLEIYLFVPILRVFVRSAETVHLFYFAALWFFLGPVLNMVGHFVEIPLPVDLSYVNQYIGYFAMGYILGIARPARKWIVASAILFLLGAAFTAYMTYLLASVTGKLDQFYYQYLRLNIVLMSLSAFVLLKAWGERIGASGNAKFLAWTRRFAEASFGIYLVHAMIIILLHRGVFGMEISVLSAPAIFMVPAIAILTTAISWLVVALLQRIPLVRRIV